MLVKVIWDEPDTIPTGLPIKPLQLLVNDKSDTSECEALTADDAIVELDALPSKYL